MCTEIELQRCQELGYFEDAEENTPEPIPLYQQLLERGGGRIQIAIKKPIKKIELISQAILCLRKIYPEEIAELIIQEYIFNFIEKKQRINHNICITFLNMRKPDYYTLAYTTCDDLPSISLEDREPLTLQALNEMKEDYEEAEEIENPIPNFNSFEETFEIEEGPDGYGQGIWGYWHKEECIIKKLNQKLYGYNVFLK